MQPWRSLTQTNAIVVETYEETSDVVLPSISPSLLKSVPSVSPSVCLLVDDVRFLACSTRKGLSGLRSLRRRHSSITLSLSF